MYTKKLHFKLCQPLLKCDKQNLQITLMDAQKVMFVKMYNKSSIKFCFVLFFGPSAQDSQLAKQNEIIWLT